MYAETGNQTDQREAAFTYHPPGGTQTGRYLAIRESAGVLAFKLNALCPPSRELSLAQTRLQEAVMWANAAIACNEIPTAAGGKSNIK